MTSPNAGQRDLLGSSGMWCLASSEPPPLDGAWHRSSLYLSSNAHTTLSPTPWSSTQEGLVRPRRMVEPPEDRGQEDFFCGPPGKLQPGPFLPSISSHTKSGGGGHRIRQPGTGFRLLRI